MKTAFFILSIKPSQSALGLMDLLSRRFPDLDVHLVSDAPPAAARGDRRIIHVDDAEATRSNYVNSSPLIGKSPIAWDKALYVFNRSGHDFAWFCEDDVLIHAHSLNFFDELQSDRSDLLCATCFSVGGNPQWPHWRFAEERFDRGDARGAFLPLCRLSRSLSDAIDRHAERYGSLSFIETMIPSLAHVSGLRVRMFPRVSPDKFRFFHEFSGEEVWSRFGGRTYDIYHPIKDDALRLALMDRRPSVPERHMSSVLFFLQRIRRHLRRRVAEMSAVLTLR